MDGFSGTKCGTGLQKKWWGDKEPSDKSSIWYKGGCPFVYDASTKSWAPQSTSGGGSGSLTGLAVLKAFIDMNNRNKYDYTGVTIGVKSEAWIWDTSESGNADVDTTYYAEAFNHCHVIAFDTERNMFCTVSSGSGRHNEISNFIFFVVDYKSNGSDNYTSIIVNMPDPRTLEYRNNVNTLIARAYNGTPVNYDDLK